MFLYLRSKISEMFWALLHYSADHRIRCQRKKTAASSFIVGFSRFRTFTSTSWALTSKPRCWYWIHRFCNRLIQPKVYCNQRIWEARVPVLQKVYHMVRFLLADFAAGPIGELPLITHSLHGREQEASTNKLKRKARKLGPWTLQRASTAAAVLTEAPIRRFTCGPSWRGCFRAD